MNILKQLKTRRSRKPTMSSANVSWRERLLEDAYVGWAVILSVSALVALVLIFFSGRLFFLIYTGAITAPDDAVSAPSKTSFDPAALNRLITSFDGKASASAALGRGYDGPSDPSR